MTTALVTRSADRRTPRQRGRETRQKLMTATIGQLAGGSYRNVTVKNIASAVNTSPATLYQYFAGVEEIVLEAAVDVARETKDALADFDGSWSYDGLNGAARLVDAVLDVWTTHHSIVRVLTAVAAEQDPRFITAYAAITRPVTRALTYAVKQHATPGAASPADRRAMVHNLTAALTAAAAQEGAGTIGGLNQEQRRAGLVLVVHATVTSAYV